MSLLTARDLAKEFGNDEIFSGVSVEIAHAARIALVLCRARAEALRSLSVRREVGMRGVIA